MTIVKGSRFHVKHRVLLPMVVSTQDLVPIGVTKLDDIVAEDYFNCIYECQRVVVVERFWSWHHM